MKQTAVEWFVDQLSYTTTDGNIISHHQNITHLFEQAKAMERSQKAEEYLKGFKDGKEYQIILDELTFKTK